MDNKPTPKETISIRIEANKAAQIKQIAKIQKRTISAVTVDLIEVGLIAQDVTVDERIKAAETAAALKAEREKNELLRVEAVLKDETINNQNAYIESLLVTIKSQAEMQAKQATQTDAILKLTNQSQQLHALTERNLDAIADAKKLIEKQQPQQQRAQEQDEEKQGFFARLFG
jgi:hypothetical protein